MPRLFRTHDLLLRLQGRLRETSACRGHSKRRLCRMLYNNPLRTAWTFCRKIAELATSFQSRRRQRVVDRRSPRHGDSRAAWRSPGHPGWGRRLNRRRDCAGAVGWVAGWSIPFHASPWNSSACLRRKNGKRFELYRWSCTAAHGHHSSSSSTSSRLAGSRHLLSPRPCSALEPMGDELAEIRMLEFAQTIVAGRIAAPHLRCNGLSKETMLSDLSQTLLEGAGISRTLKLFCSPALKAAENTSAVGRDLSRH